MVLVNDLQGNGSLRWLIFVSPGDEDLCHSLFEKTLGVRLPRAGQLALALTNTDL